MTEIQFARTRRLRSPGLPAGRFDSSTPVVNAQRGRFADRG